MWIISLSFHTAQHNGVFRTDLMAAETPDALGIGDLCHLTLHLDCSFRTNALAFPTRHAFIRNNGAFLGRFFAG